MSDDLVKRLREYGDWPQDVLYREWAEWSHKAADSIEKLEAALREIAEQIEKYDLPAEVVTWFVLQKARKALEGKDE